MDWWKAEPGARVIGDEPRLAGVTDLTHDSRLAGPGTAFIAVPGTHADGHSFIDRAVGSGAQVIVVQADREAAWARFAGSATLVVVPDTRAAMGPLASAVHGRPASQLRIVGVTGTDGKTTSSYLIAHVLERCGLAAGYLTSAGFDAGAGPEHNDSHMTTVEATVLQAQLARAVANGKQTMVVEASSEGLAQQRLAGCDVDVAVFTNLTRDHLDFHGTMENYLAAKGLLFEMLDAPTPKHFPRAAILNLDDAASATLRRLTYARVITYGLGDGADLVATDVEAGPTGLRFTVRHEGASLPVEAPLFGRFNVFNCLAALGVALSQGVALDEAAAVLVSFGGVPGRLEAVDCGQAFRVYIDIASTPAALENVLKALRPATAGRLWVIFGAAGGRDPARRDGMGRVAALLADRSVLTNEDPRDEDPDAIIEAIAAGLREGGRVEEKDFVRRPERREAIAYALANAAPGDTVLLAGKANEPTMIFEGGRQVPWNERAVAESILRGSPAAP